MQGPELYLEVYGVGGIPAPVQTESGDIAAAVVVVVVAAATEYSQVQLL